MASGNPDTHVVYGYSLGDERIQSGFTIIELMIVIVLAAVIAVFAVPAIEGVLNNNRVVSATNNLTTTIATARMAAIKANTTAQVKSTCSINNTCPDTDWSGGYQVRADMDGDSFAEVIAVIEKINLDNIKDRKKVAKAQRHIVIQQQPCASGALCLCSYIAI